MPNPSFCERAADLQDAATDAGFRRPSRVQLVRWHQFRLIPRPRQRPLVRTRGTETLYPEGTAARIPAICALLKRRRNFDYVRDELWWNRFEIDWHYWGFHLGEAADYLDVWVRTRPKRSTLPKTLRRALNSATAHRVLRAASHDDVGVARDELRRFAADLGLDWSAVYTDGPLSIHPTQLSPFERLQRDAKLLLLVAWLALREVPHFRRWQATTRVLGLNFLSDIVWHEPTEE